LTGSIAHESRQEGEWLLIAQLEALQVATLAIDRGVECPDWQAWGAIRQRAARRHRNAVRNAERIAGEDLIGE
jgi:hypothetical protein